MYSIGLLRSANLADGVGTPTALVPVPDGRLFFIEGGKRVRVVENGAVVSEPAISLPPDVPSRIVGLAADSQFARTHSLFMAWTEENSSGETRVNVTRYREVGNTLGEGAQIVTGLSTRAESSVPLSVDDAGLLYIALPGDRAAVLGGTLLRVDRDGLTPSANPRPSPILSAGFAEPTGLAIESQGNRVWMGGTFEGKPLLANISSRSASADTRSQPVAVDSGGKNANGQALAVAVGRTDGPSSLLMATGEGLRRASATTGGLGEVEGIPSIRGQPIAVARGFNEAWYVGVITESGSGRILALRTVK